MALSSTRPRLGRTLASIHRLINYFALKKSLSWGWAGSVGGAGVRRAGSAGEDPDLDQVVGEYPVSAPDRRSRSAVQAGAVPAVEPGARVITDGWKGYCGLYGLGYTHDRRSQRAARARGDDPGGLLPAVHRVASLAKRWLLSTRQGPVEEAHLPAYLNEFVFRFNRRNSRCRGMLFYRFMELAAGHEPIRYADILTGGKPRGKPPATQGSGHPPSLERPAANRPWRTTEMQLPLPLR